MTVRAGFIGLGQMGRPMARWLVDKGLETYVCDVVDEATAELVARGAARVRSPRELADRCDVIGVCVRDDEDVRQVCLGDDGIFASDHRGVVVAIHSTVYVETVHAAGAAARERGMEVLDACVTGGPMAAEAGTLTYMVGGERAAFERYQPAFATSAKTVVYTGELGTATYAKICNNALQYIAFLGVMESFNLLRHLGLPQEVLEQITRSNGLLNESCAAYMHGVVAMDEATVHSEGMQAYMRGRLEVAEKDLSIALREARRVGYAMPGTALVSQIMARIYRVDDDKKR